MLISVLISVLHDACLCVLVCVAQDTVTAPAAACHAIAIAAAARRQTVEGGGTQVDADPVRYHMVRVHRVGDRRAQLGRREPRAAAREATGLGRHAERRPLHVHC